MKVSCKNSLGNSNDVTIHFAHTNDIINKVPIVIEWLKSKQLPAHVSRYSRYMDYINAFYSTNPQGNPSEEKFEKLNWAFQELYEIVQIYKSFQDENSIDFLNRLKKVVSGNDMTPDTYTAKNDNSRDFLYELLIASDFKNHGFNVCFNDCADVIAIRGLDVVLAECKRLSSNSSLEKNLKKAGNQLDSRERKDAYGLIFIDISKCLENKIPIYEYHSDGEMISIVKRAMTEFQNDPHNLSILNHYSNKFVDAALGICLTYRRTLWLGCGEYLRVNYYMDKSIFVSHNQTLDNEKKLKNLMQSF